MSLKKFFEEKNLLYAILALAFLLRLYQLFRGETLWWDSYVYVAMGKYMFSGGAFGFWEAFRALLWPFLLGFFWWLGLPILFVAQVLDVFLSLSAVYLVYVLGKKLFDWKTGLLAALIFATTPLFLAQTGLLLTEPLGLNLGLLSVYFFIKRCEKRTRNLGLTGLFVGLSFLTKFPLGILLVVFGLITLSSNGRNLKQSISDVSIMGFAFFLIVFPYFILNHFLYGDFLQPITSGSAIVQTAVWQYNSGAGFYLSELLLKNIVLFLFYPALLYFLWKKKWRNESDLLVFLPILLFLLYFSFFVGRKELRYMTFSLPFLALFCSSFLLMLHTTLKKAKKPAIRVKFFFLLVVGLVLLMQVSEYDTRFYSVLDFSYEDTSIGVVREFSDYLNKESVLLASNPKPILFLDLEIIPTADISIAKDVYYWKFDAFTHVYVDACDYLCQEEDTSCLLQKETFLKVIEADNILIKESSYLFEGKNIKGEHIVKECRVKLYQKPPQ